MKKKSLLLVFIVLISTVWFVLAGKFEKMVTENYLPKLETLKEQGLIAFDINDFKIEKYKFKIILDNLKLYPASSKPIKFDQISSCYNPLTDEVKIYSTGKRISIGLDEIHAIDPSITIKMSRSVLIGDMDNFSISLTSKDLEFVKTADNSGIFSLDPIKLDLSVKIDEKADIYEWKFDLDTKDSSTKHMEHFKTLLSLLSAEDQKAANSFELINTLENYDDLITILGPVNYKIEYSSAGNLEHAEIVKQYMQNQISSEEFFASLKKASFDTKLNIDYGNDQNNNKLIVNLHSNEKALKVDLDVSAKSNYPENKLNSLIDLQTKYFTGQANRFLSSTDAKSAKTLKEEDLKPFAEHLLHIHDMHFGLGAVLSKENADFSGRLKANVNDYKLDLNAEGKDNKSYNGSLKLSDPKKLINAKAVFAREILLPLLEKMAILDKKQLAQAVKFNENSEANGFDALKALSKNPNFKEGEDFEADFVLDPTKFEFKINDKTFLHIMTDERVVKFLKGFDEEEK